MIYILNNIGTRNVVINCKPFNYITGDDYIPHLKNLNRIKANSATSWLRTIILPKPRSPITIRGQIG